MEPSEPQSHILINSVAVNGVTLEAESTGVLDSDRGAPQSGGVVHDDHIKLNPHGSLTFALGDDVLGGGGEVTSYPLALPAALADTDGSAQLSITVSAIPPGATLLP